MIHFFNRQIKVLLSIILFVFSQVSDFVSRYIPAYKAYLPGLYNNVPEGSQQGDVLKFRITESRSPLG